MSERQVAVNRKLIRTTLAEVKERELTVATRQTTGQGRRTPPEQTNAENFYYKKQMEAKIPMVLVLQDGEQLHGTIEWYDKGCIKLHRVNAPNLLVLKHSIKYIYKENDNDETDLLGE